MIDVTGYTPTFVLDATSFRFSPGVVNFVCTVINAVQTGTFRRADFTVVVDNTVRQINMDNFTAKGLVDMIVTAVNDSGFEDFSVHNYIVSNDSTDEALNAGSFRGPDEVGHVWCTFLRQRGQVNVLVANSHANLEGIDDGISIEGQSNSGVALEGMAA